MILTSCLKRLWLVLLAPAPLLAQTIVVDAGATNTFEAAAAATHFTWRLDGMTVGGDSHSFTYRPQLFDAGMHCLSVDQIIPGTMLSNTSWAVRVRIPLPTNALAFYVATNGSDGSDGTIDTPFKTLEKARDAVRALSRPLPAGGVTVWLRGGTHLRTNTLLLNTSTDSGAPTAPVVWRSYSNETAVVSGGRPIAAAAWTLLSSTQTNRVAPGVSPTNIWELDMTTAGITRGTNFPVEFNTWTTFNMYNQGYDGGLFELLFNGERQNLSRYPNRNLTNEDLLTTNMTMDGVAVGRLNPGTTLLWPGDSTNYLSYPGTYTNSAGVPVPVGGAFHCKSSDVARFTRWQSAFTNGGLWLQGYWRVPWQIDALKIKGFDVTNRAVLLETNASPGGGLGSKYARPVGYRTEPFWAINLLEEMDQPGEWAVDFSRKRVYFYPPAPITGGSVLISDFAAPLVQIAGASNIIFQSLTFEAGLAQGIYITNGQRNLVIGSTFRNMGNVPVDILNGGTNGVVSCDLVDLAGGGVLLRGGIESTNPAARVQARNFVVNNLITNFSRVARVYAAAVDAGFHGAGTGGGGGGHVASVGMRVANNQIATSPHCAVLHGSWDDTFEYNQISHFQQISDDLGAFYSYDYTYQHGNQTFRYNFIHDSPYGNGIDFDQDSLAMHVYGNVMNLNTYASESQGYGVVYHDYNQDIPGREQYVENFNNLYANTHIGAKFVSPLPAVIEGNASISCTTPFTWELVTLGVSTNTLSTSSQSVMQSAPNTNYTADPGFVDLAHNDLRLRPDADVYAELPTFREIPFELIGLFNDEFRTNATALPPVVANPDGATGVNTNRATLNGQLDFPWLTTAAVTVFWGTNDGGTNPLNWQKATPLGAAKRGALATNLTGLTPQTVYFYRFGAANSAGLAWATNSQSFLTAPPPPPAPTSLVATPDIAQIIISWSTVAGATSYNLKRSTTNGGPYTTLANVTGLACTNTGLAVGTTYYYVVAALSDALEGVNSVQVSAVPLPGAVKADNSIDLDQGPSWLSGSVPTGGTAVWDATVTTNGAVTIGAGVNFSGILIRDPNPNITINPGTASTLALGASGINLGSSARTLTLNARVSLLTNQTWITGSSGPTNSVQLSVTNNISGVGGIVLSNPAGCALSLSGPSNTFSGGFTLSLGARVIVAGNSNANGASSAPTSSYLGIGALTINGGSISNTSSFGLNQGIANAVVNVNSDFTMALSARMMFAGAWNLGGGTRHVTTTRGVTITNAIIAGGNTTWGLGTVSTVGSSVTNGTLRVLRDPAAVNPYVSFRLASNPTFFNNAGLALGSGLLVTLGNTDLTNALPANLATLTLGSGSILDLGETSASRNAAISSLSGAGLVANLNNTTTPGTYLATLTVNGGALTGTTEFSGRIADIDTNLTQASLYGTTAFTKSGASTQILSGNNTYSGPTIVNGGVLLLNGNQSAASGVVTVNGATLGGHGIVGGAVIVTNGAQLQPGNSLPGRLTLASNVTMVAGTRLVLEIGGTNVPAALQSSATNHDCVAIGGNATLNSALLVALANGFTPATTDSFGVLTSGGSLAGGFTNLINGRVAVTNVAGGSFRVVIGPNSVTLTNYQLLQAAFTATPTNGLAPLNVTFTDNSTGAITNRFWNFGDGFTTNIAGSSIAHTFNAPSTNLVRLVVTDGLSASTNTLTILAMLPQMPPAIGSVGVFGTELILLGTNGIAGANCLVLSSTNVTSPMTGWSVIATNQFDVNGTFRHTNPLSPTILQEFFRLSY